MAIVPGETPKPEAVKPIEAHFRDVETANRMLLMANSRYFDRPSPHRLRDQNEPRNELVDAFGGYLGAVLRDESLSDAEKSSALTVMLMELTREHSELVADHLDSYAVASTDAYNESFRVMRDELEEALGESPGTCTDKAMMLLAKAIDVDWQIVSKMYEGSWREKIDTARATAKPLAFDLAKIALGTTLGVMIANKLHKDR